MKSVSFVWNSLYNLQQLVGVIKLPDSLGICYQINAINLPTITKDYQRKSNFQILWNLFYLYEIYKFILDFTTIGCEWEHICLLKWRWRVLQEAIEVSWTKFNWNIQLVVICFEDSYFYYFDDVEENFMKSNVTHLLRFWISDNTNTLFEETWVRLCITNKPIRFVKIILWHYYCFFF